MANKPYKLASRTTQQGKTIIKIGDLKVGGKDIIIMAGPCAIENKQQLLACGRLVKKLGGKILRGGAFKPRTSPYSFQGLEEKGLKILASVGKETGLLTITEVLKPENVSLVAKYADILQIGARNMQNYSLLKSVGKSRKPVVLKRGLAATIEEWLAAAEYILKEGNSRVLLCERGIRTFETSTRFTLDISSIAVVKKISHLPIIVDPSHPAGQREFVPSLAKGAVAAGADGLLIEIHPQPEKALSDGPQSLSFFGFKTLMVDLKLISEAIDRQI